jgi:hypothetical protein
MLALWRGTLAEKNEGALSIFSFETFAQCFNVYAATFTQLYSHNIDFLNVVCAK